MARSYPAGFAHLRRARNESLTRCMQNELQTRRHRGRLISSLVRGHTSRSAAGDLQCCHQQDSVAPLLTFKHEYVLNTLVIIDVAGKHGCLLARYIQLEHTQSLPRFSSINQKLQPTASRPRVPSATACLARMCQDLSLAPIMGSLPRSLWPHHVVVCLRSLRPGEWTNVSVRCNAGGVIQIGRPSHLGR